MTRVAVYSSVLYGADFIVESIASIRRHVDAVFVLLNKRPWGGTDGVWYRGEWVRWPEKFDDTRERVAALCDPFVGTIDDDASSPWDRWGRAFGIVCERHPRLAATEVMFIDPDCVFHEDEAARMFAEWESSPHMTWVAPGQVELWRTPAWQVERVRSMVSLHRGDLGLVLKSTEATRPKLWPLAARVHNLGFCTSPAATRWKHLTSMAFSPVIGESIPNPDWYESTWLNWHPTDNNRSLEPSLRCEGTIPRAVPYDVGGLPASIKRRYDAGEWPTW